MIWPFRRKPAPPAPPDLTAASWAPGDIAECIVDGDWCNQCLEQIPGPALGERRMVTDVSYQEAPAMMIGGTVLRLVGYGRSEGYFAEHFRKVVLTENGADLSLIHI